MYTPVMTSDSATVAIRLLVGAEAPDEVVDRVVGVDRLTGVAPEALDDVVRARRVLRLLGDAADAAVHDLGDAEVTQVRGVADLGEQHAGTDVLVLEALDGLRDRSFEHVVGEHDDDLVAVGEAL